MQKNMKTTKYRTFIKATIYPQNTNSAANIYIPEPVVYTQEQEAIHAKTKWKFSFGIIDSKVVILVRHITVIDNNYVELRSTPEYYYDYKTFQELGGWLEYSTNEANVLKLDKIHSDFSSLFSKLLDNAEEEIDIIPTEAKTFVCTKDENTQIPIPINQIVKNFLSIPKGNHNCNRSLVDESFFEALLAFDVKSLQGKNCYIKEDYVLVFDSRPGYEEDGLFYEKRIKKVLTETEWEKCCYNHTVEQKKEKKRALEKHNLLVAYDSLVDYLEEHNTLKTLVFNGETKQVVNRNLKYGYKLTGFEIIENTVIWTITTYERPIAENDIVRGMDDCYLKFEDGKIIEVYYDLGEGYKEFTEDGKSLEQGKLEDMQLGILKVIDILLELNISEKQIVSEIVNQCNISNKEAEKYLDVVKKTK